MANVFDEDLEAAIELIDEYGMDVSWQPFTPDAGGTPGYPGEGAAPDPVPVRMAFFSPRDLGRGNEIFMALLAGTEVPTSGEIGLLAGGLTFVPNQQDILVRDGTRLAITKIDRLAPNGMPILYYVSVSS